MRKLEPRISKLEAVLPETRRNLRILILGLGESYEEGIERAGSDHDLVIVFGKEGVRR
jgi:hypothetical protein